MYIIVYEHIVLYCSSVVVVLCVVHGCSLSQYGTLLGHASVYAVVDAVLLHDLHDALEDAGYAVRVLGRALLVDPVPLGHHLLRDLFLEVVAVLERDVEGLGRAVPGGGVAGGGAAAVVVPVVLAVVVPVAATVPAARVPAKGLKESDLQILVKFRCEN